MKALSNNNFFKKWKPIHEKGILKYEIKNTVPSIIIIILFNIIYRIKYPIKTEAFRTSVNGSLFIVLILIVSSVLDGLILKKDISILRKFVRK